MNLEIREQELLAPMTTIGLGGPARFFAQPKNTAQVQAALGWARARALPVWVLGGGSNVLIADEGFAGLVIQPQLLHWHERVVGGEARLRVGAGVVWDTLVARAVSQGWGGVTCLSGIPGYVGAAPIQNIGAYGQELCETFQALEAIDLATGELHRFDKQTCAFGYRDSMFKRQPGKYLITEVQLVLQVDGKAVVRYPDLKKRLTANASLQAVRDTVLQVRRSKSMVQDPNDEDARSCGSFFTNPILGMADWQDLKAKAGTLLPPHFDAGNNQIKVPAAWLIEQAGFHKGYGDGPIGLSRKHTLALVHRGGGRAEDVVAFARHIRDGVMQRFGVRLVPEPVFIGLEI